MRRVIYAVAASLDGFIAGPKGEADWILMDPEIDFAAIYDRFDTILVGRRTFETFPQGDGSETPGIKTYVFSKTLKPADHPHVTVVGDGAIETVEELRAGPGKDIWLFGGGELFRGLAGAGLVDAVEVGLIPVLLGGGVPLLPPPSPRITLTLTEHKAYKNGTVSLTYAVERRP